VHLHAPPLALGVVGLGDVDGNQPLRVSGKDARLLQVVRVGQELERQTVFGVLDAVAHRQPQVEQAVN
jgi:hypothetical protein